jgi:hypothetical protein
MKRRFSGCIPPFQYNRSVAVTQAQVERSALAEERSSLFLRKLGVREHQYFSTENAASIIDNPFRSFHP